MAKIKKLKMFSFAMFQAFLTSLIGFVAGILYSFGGLLIDSLVTIGWITFPSTPGLSFGTILAFGALIVMPIIFAAFGFILGLFEAFLYNLFARWFGGIETGFVQKKDIKDENQKD